MFVDPCANLLHEIDWNINRARLAAHLVGQLMTMVFLAFGTVAARLAATAVKRDQTGSQQRFASSQLLDTAVQHPANQGGMTGNAHGGLGQLSYQVSQLTRKAPQKRECEEKAG